MAENDEEDRDHADGHYVELRLDFDAGEPDETGAHPLTFGAMKTHLHHVPNGLYVDSLLVMARHHVAEAMKDNSFRDNVPPEVRRHAAKMMATRWLMERLESPELADIDPIDATVPDDASSLFEDTP